MCKLLNGKSLLFAALLLSAISMSCSKDPQDTNSKQSGNNVHEWEDSTLSGDAVMGSAMTFKVGGGMSVERTAQTRATTNINGTATFTEDDLVAVAVTRSVGSEVVKLYRVKNNGSLEYAGGDNDPFVWKSTTEQITIRAWSYGTSTNLSYTLTAPETFDYTLETDQQTNGYRELLYCKADDKSYSSGAITLNFYHQLARMVFNVTHESSNTLTISSVSIGSSSFPQTARFNVPTGSNNVGTWVVKSGTGSITPRTETAPTTGYLATYSAVVFPTFTTQNYLKDTPFFTVTSGSNNYTYKIEESAGIAYDGNTQYNYTITVRDGLFRWNPLYYMAENNVKSFNSSTRVVTLEENPRSGGSYMLYTYADAMSLFAKQTTSYNEYWKGNITDGITNFTYHMPAKREWYSIMPTEKSVFKYAFHYPIFQPEGGLVESAEKCIFGHTSATKAGIDDWSYWSTYVNDSWVRYGIRFLGTDYCSVWRYKIDVTNNILIITAKRINRLEKNDASLATKLSGYMGNSETWWNTNSASDGNLQRILYATGEREGTGNGNIVSGYENMAQYLSTTMQEDPPYTVRSFQFMFDIRSQTFLGYNNVISWGNPVRLFRE